MQPDNWLPRDASKRPCAVLVISLLPPGSTSSLVGRKVINAGGLMLLLRLDLDASVKVHPHIEGYIINEDIDNI